MAFQFPWTNLHELNLDWFLSKFKQFANNYLGTTATAESVPYNAQPSVTVTGGELDDDTDIVNPFNFHFKIPAGMGILSLTITYNVTNDTTEPVSGWTTTTPTVDPGQYLWVRQSIILQNGTGQSYTYFVYYPVDGTTPTINIDDHPTEDSPNAVSSGGVYTEFETFAQDVMTDQLRQDANMAFVEESTTASRSYTPGEYFVNSSGVLCKITATVASGSTLIENTNYQVLGGSGGLASELTSTNHYYYKSNVFNVYSTDTIQSIIRNGIIRAVSNLSSGIAHITFAYPNHSWGGDMVVYVTNYVQGTGDLVCSGFLNVINGSSATPGESYIFSARYTTGTATIGALKISSAINLALAT